MVVVSGSPAVASVGGTVSEFLRIRSLKVLLLEAACRLKSVVESDGKALSEAGVVRPKLFGVTTGLGGLFRLLLIS